MLTRHFFSTFSCTTAFYFYQCVWNRGRQESIYPLRVSQAVVPDRHVDVNLLLYECTYCCKKCLQGYSTKELLATFAEDCCHRQRTMFPKDPRCRFTNIQKQLPAPFVVYADFESLLKPVNEDIDVTQGVDTGIVFVSRFLRTPPPL